MAQGLLEYLKDLNGRWECYSWEKKTRLKVLLAGVWALIAIAVYSEMWESLDTQGRALLILFSLAMAAFLANSLREVYRL